MHRFEKKLRMESNQPTQNDEIDLRQLFQAIGRFFSNIGMGVVRMLISLRRTSIRYKVLLVVFGIIGVLAGVGLNNVVAPHYKTTLLLNSSFYKGRLIENNIEKLSLLCREKERTGLAQTLGIPIELALKIKDFKALPFVTEAEVTHLEVLREQLKGVKVEEGPINDIIARLRIENKSSYEITVLVFDNTIIDELEQPILDFFKSNPYLKKRLENNKTNLEKKRKKINSDLAKLDSLKDLIKNNLEALGDRSREGSNNVILAEDNNTNPLSVFRESINLYDEVLEIDRKLELEAEFEVIDGFTSFSKPNSPSLLLAVFWSFWISLGLGYLVIMLLSINHYLSKVEKESMATD